MANVTLRDVRKSYGSLEVVHGVDLDIRSGEFVVFVGPSGCGKSTLLRMIAGLEHITSGDIAIDGSVVNSVPSPKRGISMVFQSYALYPHMSVYNNMAFGLQLAKVSKSEIDRKVRGAARILQIEDYLDRMPKALSGGQRQRVAIGRAIVRDPKVFLFDEPLSNLDASLRAQTRVEIAHLHDALDATMIYVTHDQVEAMTLADRIVVLNEGRIEQVGTPLELYRNPVNTFVAGFIANQRMNFLPITPTTNGLKLPGGKVFSTKLPQDGIAAILGVRPEHARLSSAEEAHLSGSLSVVEQFGEYAIAYIEIPGMDMFTIKIEGAPDLLAHQDIHVHLPMEGIHLFDKDGQSIE